MFRLLTIVVLANLVIVSLSYPNGAPTKSCDGLIPSPRGHKANPSKKPSPYTLTTELLEGSLKIKISGVPPFRGFAMQVRRASDNSLAGEFSWDEETTVHVKYMKCDPENPKASLTHSKSRSRDELVVYWSWPEGSSIPRNGDFKLVYTVVTNRKHFWVKTIPLNFSSYN